MVEAAQQRMNMVESQVMTADVTDRRILQAMREVPRERFVPAALQDLAYMDEAVPLTTPAAGGARRWLMPPRVLAKLLQLADIGAEDRVLDVGTGMGYSAAVLAGMAKSVVGLESNAALAKDAQANLAALGMENVKVVEGDLTGGCADEAPYDAIVLEGAIVTAPEALLDQLKDGGRMVAVVRQGDGLGKATIWRRLGKSLDPWTAFDAAAPLLPGFEPTPEFVL